MTRDEKLSAIRDAVVEANPAILKLDFGCLVRVGRITRGSFSHCVLPGEGLHRDTFICVGRCRPPTESKLIFQHQIGFCYVDETEVAKFHEIIGRPIRLADVLLAIFKHQAYKKRGIVTVLDSGRIYLIQDDEELEYAGCNWLLTSDSLDAQDDQVLSFLYELLCA